MEDNKYYHPSTDFPFEGFDPVIGFEYEVCDDEQADLWSKFIVDKDFRLERHIGSLERGLIRVKYLDREGIESLGWSNGDNYTGNNETTPKSLYFITLAKATAVFLEESYEGFFSIKFHTLGYPMKVKFSGTLKNKSELSRIMKMVGITK